MVRRDCQGRGYACEAAAAVISECARVHVARVWATVRPSNAASLRVLARVGMQLNRIEHDDRGSLHYLSRTFDAVAQSADPRSGST
jgi:RimJ/RimL family protein N-acetyltransferase